MQLGYLYVVISKLKLICVLRLQSSGFALFSAFVLLTHSNMLLSEIMFANTHWMVYVNKESQLIVISDRSIKQRLNEHCGLTLPDIY